MKKVVSLLLAILMALSMVACGEQAEQSDSPSEAPAQTGPVAEPGSEPAEPSVPTDKPTEPAEPPVPTDKPTEPAEPSVPTDKPTEPAEPSVPTDKPTDQVEPSTPGGELTDAAFGIDVTGITTIDELEEQVQKQLTDAIDSLSLRWKELSAELDTFKKYCENAERVSDFYETIIAETEQMCIMLCEYSAVYARMILDSDLSADDKYDAIDGINDCLYDDACDEIHDEIYEGILDDMQEYYYDGILDDAKDNVNYSDWYNVKSEEYSQWYDTSSKVYGLYYDASADIYSFYYDMSGELYSRDYDRAEKVYERFLTKINRMKGLDDAVSDAVFDTALRPANSIDELEGVVEEHVSECVQALKAEWKALSADIDTFDKYIKQVDDVEEFHARIEEAASQIFAMICDYGVLYADMILKSGSPTKDMYKDFEDFKDCIYDDACTIVKEEIYEDLLSEIKDYCYEGIIKDAKDSIKYSDWSDARSDAYNWWSDARGEVFDEWSDTRGDIFNFYTDIRSELFNGDADGANKEWQNFKDHH